MTLAHAQPTLYQEKQSVFFVYLDRENDGSRRIMRHRTTIVLTLAVAALIAGPGTAEAAFYSLYGTTAEVNQSIQGTIGSDGAGTGVSGGIGVNTVIPGFDASLGTLTQVVANYSVFAEKTISGEMTRPTSGTSSAWFRPVLTVSAGPVSPFGGRWNFNDDIGLPGMLCVGGGVCQGSSSTVSVFIGAGASDPESLTQVMQDWTLNIPAAFSVGGFAGETSWVYEQNAWDGSVIDYELTLKAYGYWSVDYSYEPRVAPVPLPPAGVLILTGLLPIACAAGWRLPR